MTPTIFGNFMWENDDHAIYGGFKDAFTVSFFAFFVVLVFTIPIFDPWPYDNITYRGQSSLTVDPYVSVHQNGWDNGDPKRI